MSENDNDRWHLDKRVPIALIITLLAYGVSGLWVIAQIKQDVEVLKAAMLSQRDRDTRQDSDAAEKFGVVRAQLDRVESKLDRLIEKKP